MDILKKENLRQGGFAGLKEHRLVIDERISGDNKNSLSWNGIGNFVYLADATFMPKGETHLHPHKEIDIISIMVSGKISHEGSLEHGIEINEDETQVQRAGAEGFKHNEINPDDMWNRMIQIWVLPETPGEPAGYKKYSHKINQLTRVYGGIQKNVYNSKTKIDIGYFNKNETFKLNETLIAYLTKGSAKINERIISESTLIKDEKIDFEALENKTQIIIIRSS